MELKDVEKKLQDAADNMELSPFSQRWAAIKDEIKVPRAKKRKPFKKWLPSVAAACAVILSAAIILPIVLRNQPSGDFAPNGGTLAPDNGVTNAPNEWAPDMPDEGVAGDEDLADKPESTEEDKQGHEGSEEAAGDN